MAMSFARLGQGWLGMVNKEHTALSSASRLLHGEVLLLWDYSLLGCVAFGLGRLVLNWIGVVTIRLAKRIVLNCKAIKKNLVERPNIFLDPSTWKGESPMKPRFCAHASLQGISTLIVEVGFTTSPSLAISHMYKQIVIQLWGKGPTSLVKQLILGTLNNGYVLRIELIWCWPQIQNVTQSFIQLQQFAWIKVGPTARFPHDSPSLMHTLLIPWAS